MLLSVYKTTLELADMAMERLADTEVFGQTILSKAEQMYIDILTFFVAFICFIRLICAIRHFNKKRTAPAPTHPSPIPSPLPTLPSNEPEANGATVAILRGPSAGKEIETNNKTILPKPLAEALGNTDYLSDSSTVLELNDESQEIVSISSHSTLASEPVPRTSNKIIRQAKVATVQVLRRVDSLQNEGSVSIALEMVSCLITDAMHSITHYETEAGVLIIMRLARTFVVPVIHAARRAPTDVAIAGTLELARLIAKPAIDMAEHASPQTACTTAIFLVQTMAAPLIFISKRLQPEEAFHAALRLVQTIAGQAMPLISKQPADEALRASITLAQGIYVEAFKIIQKHYKGEYSMDIDHLAHEAVARTVCAIAPISPSEAIKDVLL